MQFPERDLTAQYISSSYQDVIQRYSTTSSITYILDGTGDVIFSIPTTSIGQQVLTVDQTASYAHYTDVSNISISSSYSLYSDFSETSSLSLISRLSNTASLSNTSSVSISSSYANISSLSLVSDVALLADTASLSEYSLNSISSSFSSASISSSYAVSASWAPSFSGSGTTLVTASTYQITSSLTNNSLTSSNLLGLILDNTSSITLISQSNIVVTQKSTSSYDAVFYDYIVKNGTNSRAGILFGTWNNNIISYTECADVDIGDTSDVTMSIVLNQGNVQLLINTNNSINWTIKSMGRYL